MVQKREPFTGEERMAANGENVAGSVAAFVTTAGQSINIIHGEWRMVVNSKTNPGVLVNASLNGQIKARSLCKEVT